jgi:hypothetical protein
MKKIISLVIASFMFCNIGFAERAWVKTDYTISYYLKNDWALTFVNAFKGFSDDEVVYTLQRSKLIISCKTRGSKHRRETCYKPADQ